MQRSLRCPSPNRSCAVALFLVASLLVASAAAADRGRSRTAKRARAVVPPTSQPSLRATSRPSGEQSKLTVYYFHRTMRCPTCKRIEELAEKAVRSRFAEALENGTIAWKSVNMEEPANRHFEKDFKLESQSLVLVRSGGSNPGWKTLEKVWDLVGTPEEFTTYVQTELRRFISVSTATQPASRPSSEARRSQ